MPIKRKSMTAKPARRTPSRKARAKGKDEDSGPSVLPVDSFDGIPDEASLKGEAAIHHKRMTFGDEAPAISWQVLRIMSEFVDGFEFLSKLRRSVTFFGSARLREDDPHYRLARELGRRLAAEKYTVVTGGGPGIMEAGNRGAVEGGGLSVGLNIELPLEQHLNPWVRQGMGFHYFFSRKFMLDYSAMAYVYFPGGYGTLDELFTVLTLIQTGKADRNVPVILMGERHWTPLTQWMKQTLVPSKLIAAEDLAIWHCTDDIEEVLRIIRNAGDRVEGGG